MFTLINAILVKNRNTSQTYSYLQGLNWKPVNASQKIWKRNNSVDMSQKIFSKMLIYSALRAG